MFYYILFNLLILLTCPLDFDPHGSNLAQVGIPRYPIILSLDTHLCTALTCLHIFVLLIRLPQKLQACLLSGKT